MVTKIGISGSCVIEFKKIMDETNTVSIFGKQIPSINSTI